MTDNEIIAAEVRKYIKKIQYKESKLEYTIHAMLKMINGEDCYSSCQKCMLIDNYCIGTIHESMKRNSNVNETIKRINYSYFKKIAVRELLAWLNSYVCSEETKTLKYVLED